MRSAYYPKADRTSAWHGDQFSGTVFLEVEKVVFHTTETTTLPGYSSGASAPTFTYSPSSGRWWQHFRLDRSARALRNLSGGVETNTDDVVQIEIICFSDKTIADAGSGRLWVGNLPDRAYEDLADFAQWIHEEWGVPLRAAPYPTRYVRWGESRFRLSGSTFNGFRGFMGHLNVPENTHWDPSVLNISRILRLAQEEDEVSYKDWPEESQTKLVQDVASAVKRELLDDNDIFRRKDIKKSLRETLADVYYKVTRLDEDRKTK